MYDPNKQLHPATEDTLRFFDYSHLPEGPLRDLSERCHTLAYTMAYDTGTSGAQLTTGLHDLLRAKDCFVRSALPSSSS
jgi:hypothetical protein